MLATSKKQEEKSALLAV